MSKAVMLSVRLRAGTMWTLKDGRVVKLLVAIENGGDGDD